MYDGRYLSHFDHTPRALLPAKGQPSYRPGPIWIRDQMHSRWQPMPRPARTLDPTNGRIRDRDVRLLVKGIRWPQQPASTSWISGISSRLSQPPSYAID